MAKKPEDDNSAESGSVSPVNENESQPQSVEPKKKAGRPKKLPEFVYCIMSVGRVVIFATTDYKQLEEYCQANRILVDPLEVYRFKHGKYVTNWENFPWARGQSVALGTVAERGEAPEGFEG